MPQITTNYERAIQRIHAIVAEMEAFGMIPEGTGETLISKLLQQRTGSRDTESTTPMSTLAETLKQAAQRQAMESQQRLAFSRIADAGL